MDDQEPPNPGRSACEDVAALTNLTDTLEEEGDTKVDDVTTRVLQHYHPGYPSPLSTFKQIPANLTHMLADR
jgi:hypothetical protein